MPADSVQLSLIAIETTLLFAGAGLLIWVLANPRQRQRWLKVNSLAHWPVTMPEFLLFVMAVLLGGFIFQSLAHLSFAGRIASTSDKAGLEIFVYGFGMHGGFLLGYFLFPILRRALYYDYRTEPSGFRDAPPLPWPSVLRYAAGVLLIVLPVLTLLSLGWTMLIRAAGLPDEPQDLIAIFGQTKSTLVVIGMLIVACGLAPLSEELLFRSGVYRFCRQNHMGSVYIVCIGLLIWGFRMFYLSWREYSSGDLDRGFTLTCYGFLIIASTILIFRFAISNDFVERHKRLIALLLSSCLFGFLHGNWAGFLPLTILGMLFALAYEATGSIRVVIVAHSLFNLNTILVVLSGLHELGT